MSEALVKNAADEEQVAEAKELERFHEERELDDMFFIMNSIPGRRYVKGLLDFCGIFKTSFNAEEPTRTYFNEGQRNIGLKLMGDIQTSCPELYVRMIEEAKLRGDKKNARNKPRSTGTASAKSDTGSNA